LSKQKAQPIRPVRASKWKGSKPARNCGNSNIVAYNAGRLNALTRGDALNGRFYDFVMSGPIDPNGQAPFFAVYQR